MHYRDYLQQLIYRIINPLVKGMIKVGITPNIITTTGLVLNIVAAAVFIYAGYMEREASFFYVGVGGGVVLFAGLLICSTAGWPAWETWCRASVPSMTRCSTGTANCLHFSVYSSILSCKDMSCGPS